ncbi:hypothetical protein F4777DRAFT_3642 [Nemania sp. FL0916]|nr:hypothetical protein F4777DRAFT_3642 [Nemania sp. FL0916]
MRVTTFLVALCASLASAGVVITPIAQDQVVPKVEGDCYFGVVTPAGCGHQASAEIVAFITGLSAKFRQLLTRPYTIAPARRRTDRWKKCQHNLRRLAAPTNRSRLPKPLGEQISETCFRSDHVYIIISRPYERYILTGRRK